MGGSTESGTGRPKASLTFAAADGVSFATQPRKRRHGGGVAHLFGGYAFVLPALVLVAAVIYYAIWYDGVVSFSHWSGLTPTRTPAGWSNFRRAWHDPTLRAAIVHTVEFGIVTVPLQALFGFSLACLLTARVRLSALYRAIIFIPSVLAPAVIAPMARYFLAPDGWLDEALRFVGLTRFATGWLGNPHTALWALAAVNVWEWTGFSFMLYLAALTLIDRNLYEAARVDGASAWTTMWRIAFPLARPTHTALAILGTISTLKLFDIIYLTTVGGPGTVSEVFSTYIYRQDIARFDVGYAAALSVILLVIALTVTILQLSIYRRLDRN